MQVALQRRVARRRRFFEQGFSWHVTQRGANRGVIFKAPTDYRVFLSILKFESECYDFQVHAYTLMRNHVHVLGTPGSEQSMPKLMQALGRRYVPFFNCRYKRTGTLWESRYRPALVHDERYWLTCMRYVELNAVRAAVVSEPEEYRWSSYLHHALGVPDEIVTEHPLYLNLGASPAARQQAWREICGHRIPESDLDRLRQAMKRGIVIGEPTFVEVD
jgi:putative transposase